MKLAAIDELYESIQSRGEMSLTSEYASKLMQVAVACSGQHVLNLSSQLQLGFSQQKEIIQALVKSVQESLENYINEPINQVNPICH